jgi:protein SCO1/2
MEMTDRLIPKSILSLALLVLLSLGMAACFSTPYTFNGTPLDPPKPLPDLELMSTEGRPFRLSETKGDFTLVYFGYTFCPDVCPLTMVDVKQALSELEEDRERVQVLFVSVDPERDTPEVLDRYLAAFDPAYIGLTDEPAKIEEVKAAFGVFSAKEEVAGSAAGYLVSHSSYLFLLNPQGELHLLYAFGFEPEDLRSDLAHLLQEG